jgi:hypothetical protein
MESLADESVPLIYIGKYREYGILYVDGGTSFGLIDYCPFCGVRLPQGLREEWFETLDSLGVEPDDSSVPTEMTDETWWRVRGL